MKPWVYWVIGAVLVYWFFIRKSKGLSEPLVFTNGGWVPASKAKGSWGGYDTEGDMRNAPR